MGGNILEMFKTTTNFPFKDESYFLIRLNRGISKQNKKWAILGSRVDPENKFLGKNISNIIK